MDRRIINLDGVDFEVSFFHQEGMRGDHYQPDDQDTLEIMEVEIDGIPILCFLAESVIDRFKEKIYEQI